MELFLAYNAQYIHMFVQSQTDGRKFYLTMIYASNDLHERVELLDFLNQVATNYLVETLLRLKWNSFKNVSLYVVWMIFRTGALYTWPNKQAASDRVYSRLDRAMGNLEWMAMYGDYIAHFYPEALFDHCPCTVVHMRADLGGKRNFKYFNMWGTAAEFKPSVLHVWSRSFPGTKMFGVIKKLKALKPVLKRLNTACFSDIENTTTIASLALANIQQALVDNPVDVNLIQQELDLARDLKELTVARDSFLSQKAKVQWSIEGDLNTAYFHHAIKKRTMMNKVFKIEDKDGRLCTEGADIQMAFLDYYQGDIRSIMLLLRALSTFSATSGLRVNAAKSEVVFNGVPYEVRMDVVQVSGFQQGVLPFKYLGVPIQPGRLSKADCHILLDKVVHKIRGIGARKLSYAGRLVLINSVLNTLHNYWASIFLIPKGVINRIEAICRNFFWSGESEYHRVPLIAWEKICCRKKEGGLNIKRAEVWNKATVGKLVNWIHTKADRLWVLWIDPVYLKGADWHSYQPPPDSNWNWRNICKVKDLLNSGFVGGHWQSDARGYSIQSGYYWLQGPHPLVQWYNSVWATWNIPKHSLVGWMVKHKGLQLRDKLFQLQICDSNSCVNCEQAAETHEHLFGSCVYSSQVIDGVEQWLCRRISGSNLNCTKLQKLVVRMTLMATWYCIWKQRNECRLSLTLATPRRVIKEIQSIVKARILQKIQTIMPQRDKEWLLSLDIHV
ncbi:uncharacterized protein LOC141651622 [Silene latifolia]|uniref:uncharacterized protein LOC141651622 n=1 Tax=Silene latifolia TaxID=37657 RepID=UPI003D776A10